jgi:hypothetical protein
MKKVIPFLFPVILLMSCQKGENNPPYMKFPEYKTSKEEFKNKISPVDSVAFNTEYQSIKRFYNTTSKNKLVIKIFTQLEVLNEDELNQKGSQIHKLALSEIANIQNYQVLEVNWMASNTGLKYTQEFLIY